MEAILPGDAITDAHIRWALSLMGLIALAIALLSLRKMERRNQAEALAAKRALIESGRALLDDLNTWRDERDQKVVVQDELYFIVHHPNYSGLLPYLQGRPRLGTFIATDYGTETDAYAWLLSNIRRLEEEWGLIQPHKKARTPRRVKRPARRKSNYPRE